jgi:hypothetical protein
LKCGKARAAKLSPQQRTEIAKRGGSEAVEGARQLTAIIFSASNEA